MTRVGIFLAAAFCIALMSTTTSAQVPILYYDFENNTTRTTFENAVEQSINGGSGAITRAGNTTTITGVAGAGVFNGGAANGQAASGTNWDASTTDPGAAATNYFQFVANTSGFSGLSVIVDNQASATGPARIGISYSTNGTTFTSVGTALTGNAVFSKLTADLSGVAAINNQPSVTIRLYAYAGSAADRTGRSAFGSGGTFRIDNLEVRALSTVAGAGTKTLLNELNIFTSTTSGLTGSVLNRGNFTVTGAGTTIVLGSTIAIATGSTLTVSNSAIFTSGTVFNPVIGAGNFTLNSGATREINSANGITSIANAGNIQVTGTRTFSGGANYVYNRNAAGAQVTGNQLPTTITGNLTVALGASADSPLTLTQSTTVNGSTTINAGSIFDTASNVFATGAGVTNNGVFRVNGTFQINTGGFVSGNAPTYGVASNLKYNTGGTYGRAGEWLPGATSGAGYPFNVQLSNNTTLDLPNGSTGSPFQMAGNLTIDTGSSMQMAGSTPLTQPLTVLGNILINGNLNLSTASGGDIKVGGNWTRGGTYSPNGRAVFFIGAANQTVSVSSGGSETFVYLIVDKPGGNLVINNVAPANDILVNAAVGDVLQILNAGGIDLNGRSLVMQNNGGNILVSGGIRNVTGAAGSSFEFTGSKTVTGAAGGSLVYGTGVGVRLKNSVNFGASLTTINGTLFVDSGGAVNANPPTYSDSSALEYDCGCVYGRSTEWSATSGPGYPSTVRLSSNTTLDLGANGGANVLRQMRGLLVIDSTSELSMAITPMTAALNVLNDVNNQGTLTLSTSLGGDLHIVDGNFVSNGTFNSNNRALFFEGSQTRGISSASGALSIPYLRINKTGGTIQLVNTDVTTLGPNGGDSIQFTGATSTLTLNGRTLTLGSTVSATAAGSGFVGDAAADLSLQDGGTTGAMGTLVFVAGGQTLENLTINRTGGAGSATLGSNLTLIAALNLTAGDILTGAFTLTHNGTSTGTTDVVGNVRRTDLGSTARQFGNPNNQISFQTGTAPTEMTVNLVKSRPTGAGFGFPNAVNRTYTITPTGGSSFTSTLRLHYNDADLSGTPIVGEEAALDLWRFNGTSWNRIPKTLADPITGNWIESSLVTQFSPWTLSANPLAPTVARLRSFNATNYGGVTVLEWQTRYELDNLGFNVYREQGGKRTLITPSLVAGSALLVGSKTALTAGNSYTWIDRNASPAARYWVEDIDLDGKSRMNGPLAPVAGSASDANAVRHEALLLGELGADASDGRGTQRQWMATDAGAREPMTTRTATASQFAGVSPQLEALEQQRILAAQASVKIAVRGRGWRRIGRAELVAAGLSPSADPTRLQVFVGGVEIPIRVDDAQWRQGAGAVEFYGEGLDRPSTDTQIYWLVEGTMPGKRIALARSNGGRPPRAGIGAQGVPVSIGTATPPAAASFDYTVERRDRTIYFSSLLNGEEENFFGRPVTPSGVTQTMSVRDLDASSERAAQLRVALQGITATAHQVRVLVNGAEVGTFGFDGRTRGEATFNVAPSLLREGDNDVRMVALGGSSDTSLTDYIRLTYAHLYRAEGDALRVPVASGSALNVAGFTSPNIRVMDITDPANLAELGATVRAEEDGTYVAAVPARNFTGAERTLFAFADTNATPVDTVVANQPSSWHTGEHGADLVIVTHASFRASVAPLVAARTAEGLSVEVVEVEDLYDEWSYGAHSPLAIREFLAGARDNWERAPRYVLLVGDGSFDPRNHLKRGAWDLVPAKLVDTTLMETASDGWLADFDDDGLPEMAVGRLPVRTTAEASRVVQKIAAHQFSQTQTSAVLVSDRPGADGYDFEAASSSVEATLPEGVAVERVNRGTRAAEEVRGEIIARVNAGPLVVNWMGHGSIDVWTGDGLLRSQDAAALSNGNRLPLFVMMTCLNGYYQDPLLESLSEALLKAEQGGALAVWTSTGMTEPEGQVQMNRELYRVLFDGAGQRLGDAMQRAKSATADRDVRRTWVLIGDPTTRLR